MRAQDGSHAAPSSISAGLALAASQQEHAIPWELDSLNKQGCPSP